MSPDKPVSRRTAVAEGQVRMSPEGLRAGPRQRGREGRRAPDRRGCGHRWAGKRTGELIPLCHPLPLDLVRVECTADPALPGVRVTATAVATGRTGVEMEALTAVVGRLPDRLRHGEGRWIEGWWWRVSGCWRRPEEPEGIGGKTRSSARTGARVSVASDPTFKEDACTSKNLIRTAVPAGPAGCSPGASRCWPRLPGERARRLELRRAGRGGGGAAESRHGGGRSARPDSAAGDVPGRNWPSPAPRWIAPTR